MLWIRGSVIQHLEGGERAEGYTVSSPRVRRRRREKHSRVVPAQRSGRGIPQNKTPEKPQAMVKVQPADCAYNQRAGNPSAMTYMVALVDLPSMDSEMGMEKGP